MTKVKTEARRNEVAVEEAQALPQLPLNAIPIKRETKSQASSVQHISDMFNLVIYT
jgi:hypothetical protein